MGLYSRSPIRFSCLSQYETCGDAATQPRLQSPGLSLSSFPAFPKNDNIISSHSIHFLRWESPSHSSVTMKQAVWCGAQRKYLCLSRSYLVICERDYTSLLKHHEAIPGELVLSHKASHHEKMMLFRLGKRTSETP